MSGAVAAHAAYNGSGTQGLAVTNKIHDDDGDVMSVFWNKNDTTRQLLYGSSIIEIPSNGASNLSYGSSRLFTVNNDIDCLGDLYLQLDTVTPTYTTISHATVSALTGAVAVPITLTVTYTDGYFIDVTAAVAAQTVGFIPNTTFTFKVNDSNPAIMGGPHIFEGSVTSDASGTLLLNQVVTPILPIPFYWMSNAQTSTITVTLTQTISVEPQPPHPRGRPFILQSLIERVEFQVGTQIWQTIENQDLRVVNSTELSPDAFYESSTTSSGNAAWLVIPSLTKTLGPALGKFTNQTEGGYPMAAAPHQSVKIKVTLVEKLNSTLSFGLSNQAQNYEQESIFLVPNENIPYRMKIGTTVLFAAVDGVAVTPATAVGGVGTIGGHKIELRGGSTISAGSVDVDVSNPTTLNLFAKQQIMCNEEREQMKAMPMGLPKRLKMTQNSYTSDIGASTIKTIELDHFSLYASHLIISGNAGFDSSGNAIRIKTAELKLNSSSFSGQLPGVLLDSCTSDSLGIFANKYLKGGDSNSNSITVDDFGIGTYVFPLSATAYSGACVPLNRFDSIRLTLTFTSTPIAGSATFINVTCVGETTALFKGGAASLAMY